MVGKSDFSAATRGWGELTEKYIFICTALYCWVLMTHTHLACDWTLPPSTHRFWVCCDQQKRRYTRSLSGSIQKRCYVIYLSQSTSEVLICAQSPVLWWASQEAGTTLLVTCVVPWVQRSFIDRMTSSCLKIFTPIPPWGKTNKRRGVRVQGDNSEWSCDDNMGSTLENFNRYD